MVTLLVIEYQPYIERHIKQRDFYIMENFRIIPVGALAVNCYLVFLEKSKLLLIVDPGDDADLIISAAKSFAYEKAAIILTHSHVDHIGAVPEINKALNCEFVYLASGDTELYNSPDNHILPYLPTNDNVLCTLKNQM